MIDCLDSCVKQDIPSSRYEIICVDDGSTDSCNEILSTYQNSYDNIFVYRQENSGVGEARNTGLDNAHGIYVWFLDADDYIEENCLNEIINAALQTGCDRLKIQSYAFTEKLREDEIEKKAQRRLVSNYPCKDSIITRTIIRRMYIEEHRIRFYKALSYGEDTIFNYQTRLYHPRDTVLSLIAYFYRRHDNAATIISSTDVIKRKKYIESCKIAIDIVTNDYNSRALPHRIVLNMLEYWIKMMLEQFYYYGAIDDSFTWDGKKIKILPFDIELIKLNRLCSRINECRRKSDLDFFVTRMFEKKSKKRERQMIKKRMIGYVKHPKRVLKLLANKND